MAEAVTARWHGDNYQARVFWENALNLLDESSCVVEVTFEANGPKSFDDVVVHYDPPVVRTGPERVSSEYHQVKWHVQLAGDFGYEDLIDPAFIGATSTSLLERLRDARKTAAASSRFAFVTTYRIRSGDPLAHVVSGVDKSLLVEKLFDGTTDRSKMGQVRKLWREHLQLTTDEQLRETVSGLRILEGHRTLDELRVHINLRAKVVGLLASDETRSDFRYDELARQLKVRQLNRLTRESLRRLCEEEGLIGERPAAPDSYRPIAIRSFLGPAADIVGASPEDTLLLLDQFQERYLRDGTKWQADIRPKVEKFLRGCVTKSPSLRLILDAHASIAFLAGKVLDLKSAVAVELVQKGRVGSRTWRADDGSKGSKLSVSGEHVGSGADIAAVVSLTWDAGPQARAYVASHLPGVGRIVDFLPEGGPGQTTVAGGAHAALLAEQIATKINAVRAHDRDAVIHLFAAVPNSLLFFLGQQHQGVAPCIVYEYDFDRRGNKTYQPSFIID